MQTSKRGFTNGSTILSVISASQRFAKLANAQEMRPSHFAFTGSIDKSASTEEASVKKFYCVRAKAVGTRGRTDNNILNGKGTNIFAGSGRWNRSWCSTGAVDITTRDLNS